MRERHLEFVVRWAAFVRSNPDWKKIHTQFINAQFEKHREILEKLAQTPEGREKIKKAWGRK